MTENSDLASTRVSKVEQQCSTKTDASPQSMTGASSTNKTTKAMRTPQGLNNAMFSINMGAILIGIKENSTLSLNTTLLFTIFFILLRIKIYLDDSSFLEDDSSDNRPQKRIGYLTSIFSWILFSFSAYHLNDSKTNFKYWFFIAAMSFSMIWVIIAAVVSSFKSKKHNIWFITNLIYIGGSVFLICINKSQNFLSTLIVSALLITLIVDAILSKPLENFGN